MLIALIIAITLFSATPAAAEPVSGLIGLTALITSFGVAAETAAVVGGTIVAFGASLALNAASTVLAKTQQKKALRSAQASLTAGVASEVQGFRVPTRGSSTVREIVFGEVLKSGPVFFDEIKGPYWYIGLVLAAHEIDSVEQIRVGNDVVVIDSNGLPVASPYFDGTRYFFKISFRLGTDDQAIDPILAADFPEVGSQFRQRGLATVVIKMYAGTTDSMQDSVWGRESPNFLFLVRGKKLFNPRDPSQVSSDPSTWLYSANAALALATWLTDADGGQQPWSNINLDYLRAAADICDEKVGRKDGSTESRYICNGIVTTSDDPATVFDDLLLNMLGTVTDFNGQIGIVAGGRREAVRTLHDGSARGPLVGAMGRAFADEVTTVRASFVSPEREYEVSAGPVYKDTAKIAALGEEKTLSVSLPFAGSVGQVQRICKHLINRASLGKTIDRTEDIEACLLVPTDVVQVWYGGDLDVLNGLYEIAIHRQDQRMDEFNLTLLEYDADLLYGWNPAVDEQDWENPIYNEDA